MMKIILLLLGMIACSGILKAAEKPNIVLILNDDQGYQDLGCYGSPDIETPRVDQMAREGMLFTEYYVASPVCSASRAALMTGCYPHNVGLGHQAVLWPNRNHGLSPDHVTIAEVLKDAGYATKAVGKWHLGDEPRFLPTNQGFDSYYGIPYSNDMYPAKSMKYSGDCLYLGGMNQEKLAEAFAKMKRGQPRTVKNKVPLMRDEECIEFPCDQSTITCRYTDEGIKFISRCAARKEPFFLYLANSMPHTPLFASSAFKGKSKRGLYGDVIEEIDFNTGRILDHLKALGLEENTIVIFTSDNGPWLVKGEHGGSALPLFEGKMTCFEGGQRVPAIIKWPAKISAGSVCSEMTLSMDLFPTLARAAGAKLKLRQSIDGNDITDMIVEKPGAKTEHKYFFFAHGQAAAVRKGEWKYHKKEIFKVKKTKRDTTGPSLYNLKQDVGESKNLINDYPEIAEELSRVLEEHLQQRKAAK